VTIDESRKLRFVDEFVDERRLNFRRHFIDGVAKSVMKKRPSILFT